MRAPAKAADYVAPFVFIPIIVWRKLAGAVRPLAISTGMWKVVTASLLIYGYGNGNGIEYD